MEGGWGIQEKSFSDEVYKEEFDEEINSAPFVMDAVWLYVMAINTSVFDGKDFINWVLMKKI